MKILSVIKIFKGESNSLLNLHKRTRQVVSKLVGDNEEIQSLLQSADLGRYDNPINLFQTNIKLYDVIDKSKSTWSEVAYSKYLTCYHNNLQLQKVVQFDCKDMSVKIFDGDGILKQLYTPAETEALMMYKHDSNDIHKLLRTGIIDKTTSNVKKMINKISGIFENPLKVSYTKEDMYVYRAVDRSTLKTIKSILKGQHPSIIEDKSFTSVTTKKRKTFQFLNFRNFNYIMKIRIPKGTKYINMDDVGNSIVYQNPENELLLNKGSLFKINRKNGFFVEADYVGKV